MLLFFLQSRVLNMKYFKHEVSIRMALFNSLLDVKRHNFIFFSCEEWVLFWVHGVLFILFSGKKSALFCVIFPFTGGFFKVKPMLI